MSRFASFRVECMHDSVIIYMATRRIRFRLLFCHYPFRHGPKIGTTLIKVWSDGEQHVFDWFDKSVEGRHRVVTNS